MEGPAATKRMSVLRAVLQVMDGEAANYCRLRGSSLNPGGELLISGGGILNDDRLGPLNAVFMNINFLNVYRESEAYTEAEHRAWLADAGFAEVTGAQLPDGKELIRDACRADLRADFPATGLYAGVRSPRMGEECRAHATSQRPLAAAPGEGAPRRCADPAQAGLGSG